MQVYLFNPESGLWYLECPDIPPETCRYHLRTTNWFSVPASGNLIKNIYTAFTITSQTILCSMSVSSAVSTSYFSIQSWYPNLHQSQLLVHLTLLFWLVVMRLHHWKPLIHRSQLKMHPSIHRCWLNVWWVDKVLKGWIGNRTNICSQQTCFWRYDHPMAPINNIEWACACTNGVVTPDFHSCLTTWLTTVVDDIKYLQPCFATTGLLM